MNVPHDLDAERHLLSAMLTGSNPVQAALPLVTSTDLHSPAHSAIFAAVVALHAAGRPADTVTVVDYLRTAGELETVGGHSKVLDVSTAGGYASQVTGYARIVANLSAARRLLGVASELIDLAHRGGDIGDAVDHGRALLDTIELPSADLPAGLVGLDDFLDRPVTARAPWVVPGLLRQDWRVVVVATEGAGKSLMLRQIAQLAAQGQHPFAFTPVDKITSLIIDLENPDDGIEHGCSLIRTPAMRKTYERNRTYLWSHRQGLNLRARADRALMDRVCSHVRPDLVVMGPLNKMFSKERNESDEQAAADTQRILDDLRTRHRFGLIIEHHAPKGQGGYQRELVPFGSQRWQSWPELGVTFRPEGDYGDVRLGRFRGDRLPAKWPDVLQRGGSHQFPWVGKWEQGMTEESVA